jgi:hypothetical protein
MKSRISDFKIAEFLIRSACRRCGCSFIDMPIEFGGHPGFDGSKITVSKSDRLSKTIFQIVTSYLSYLSATAGDAAMTNEDKVAFVNYTVSVVRELSYGKDGFSDAFSGETSLVRLNRFPFVWLIIRDVVCPSINVPHKNPKVVAGRDSTIDVARYVDDGDFVFLNNGVENQGCRLGYLLFEGIRAQGLDPRSVVSSLMSKSEMWDKVSGFAKAALVESSDVNDFVVTLAMLSDQPAADSLLETDKTAETRWNRRGLWSQAQAANLWWHFGLIEKMLDPAREPDWTGYVTSRPFIEELWNKVEDEKKKRGMDELPMEALLRIQSEEFKQRPDLIIQGLLADNRVW